MMELTIKRQVLLEALGPVAAVVPVRTTKPILQMIRFDAEPAEKKDATETSRLHLAATCQDISVLRTVEGPPAVLHVGKNCGGRLLYEPGRLIRILKELDDETVTLRTDPKGAAIQGNGARFVLPTVDETEAQKFPAVTPWDQPDFRFEIQAGQLRKMLKKTLFAVSKKEVLQRFAVSGILWELEGEKLILAGTDTKRLSVVETKVERNGEAPPSEGKPPSLIVPRETCELLLSTLDEDDTAPVRASVIPTEAVFQVGSLTIRSIMVAGRFPPWRDIIPKKAQAKYQVETEPTIRSLKQSKSMTNKETFRVDLVFGMGGLTILAGDKDAGDSELFVEHKEWAGKSEAAFNPDYLIDVLKSVDGDSIQAEIGGHGKPSVFRSGDEYTHLIMALS